MNATNAPALSRTSVVALYRQVLRYAAASVLYNRRATRNIRRLYREDFERWMKVANRIGLEGERASGVQTKDHDGHLNGWNEFTQRVNRTLHLFNTSSHHTSCLPHNLTKNLSLLSYHLQPPPGSLSNYQRLARARGEIIGTWDPKSPDAFMKRKSVRKGEIVETGWNGLGDVVAMAERTAGLVLGKVRARKKLPV